MIDVNSAVFIKMRHFHFNKFWRGPKWKEFKVFRNFDISWLHLRRNIRELGLRAKSLSEILFYLCLKPNFGLCKVFRVLKLQSEVLYL